MTQSAKVSYISAVSALSYNYDALLYFNLDSGEIDMFKIPQWADNEDVEGFKSSGFSIEYFVKNFVCEEDRESVVSELNVETFLQKLASGRQYVLRFRVPIDGEKVWHELRFTKADGDSNSHGAIAGMRNIEDKVMREQEEINRLDGLKTAELKRLQNETKRNLDIIGILASEYSSVYYIDLLTDGLTPYTMNSETESEFGQIFNSGITYSEAFKLYVDKLILPEDKEMMLKAGSRENIIRELKDKKAFLTQYRSSDNKYSQMRFVKVGGESDEPVAVALGFAEKDEEVRRMKEMELQQTRYYAVVKALSSEYGSIYYADIQKDIVLPYGNSARIVGKFGKEAFVGMTMSQACDAYVSRACLPEDREGLANALSVDNIMSQLKDKQYFTYIYRNDSNQYCEMKCVRADESGPISNVVLGFAVKDDEIRGRMKVEEEKQRNFDIIEILASEYTSVYYIDLTTDGLNPYTMNEETETSFGSVFRSGIKYSEAYRLYVDKLVFSGDKEMMLKAGSIGNIMKELRQKKTFLTTYRNAEGHYSEMKFVKVGKEDGIPVAVALGFADKDEELRARQEEERKLQRNIDIIEILASEYSSVYYIDLMTDELDPYTMNEQTETEFGKIFRSGIHYSDAFKMYVDTLVYPDDKPMMLKAGSIYNILKELSGKKTFITTYRSSEGHYSEMKFVKVGDEENPRSVALGFADKDEEIRTEMERKEREARDNSVISGLADDYGCVVQWSLKDDSEHNYRFDRMFENHIPGWSSIKNFRERLSTLINSIMHPDDREAFRAATDKDVILREVAGGVVYYVNFRIVIDGDVIYYQAKFVKDETSDNYIIAGFHNVDAETKRELEALEKAENASRAKTDFLFNMSHDIRTPMNAIIGFTNLAKQNICEPEKAMDSLDKVSRASNMLLSLINDILDMSRIESGKVKLNEKPAVFPDIINGIRDVMAESARMKGISLNFNVGDVKNSCLLMDMARVERILVNLVSNSVKYTPAGGKVEVNLRQSSDVVNGMAMYEFEVADNGIGMSEDFQGHMFDEFAREETSTISGIQGTGLGLSLAKKLTVLMGGEITCRSKQGEGSVFTVTIPFKVQDIEEEISTDDSAEAQAAIDLTGKVALLVEDNELNREIATAILEMYGLRVEPAVDGRMAIDIVMNKGPRYYDFILMDIQMPIMDGYEATRKLRRMMPNLNSPIIALSANAFEEDKQKSREAGMDDHIAKPIDVDELMSTLKKFLNQEVSAPIVS